MAEVDYTQQLEDINTALTQQQSTIDAIASSQTDMNTSFEEFKESVTDSQGSILDAINNLDLNVTLSDGTDLGQLLSYGDLLLVVLCALLVVFIGCFVGYLVTRLWR